MTSLREAMAAAQAKVTEVKNTTKHTLSWREVLDMGYKRESTIDPWTYNGGIGSVGWNS